MASRYNRYAFEQFITDTARATSTFTLVGTLNNFMGSYGYDRVIFNDFQFPQAEGQPLGVNGLPAEFWRYYTENNCFAFDPIHLMVERSRSAFRWDGLSGLMKLSKKQTDFMHGLEDLGLRRGVALPMGGRSGLDAVVGLISSEKSIVAEPPLALLEAAVTQFYAVHSRLMPAAVGGSRPYAALSAKERDVLSWMAAGKTDDEIAAILSITRSTVNAHSRHIFQKLGAHNRVKAVVVGILDGHIRP